MDIVDLVVGQSERVVGAVILVVFVDVVFVEAASGRNPDMSVGVFGKGVDFLVGEDVGQYGATVMTDASSGFPLVLAGVQAQKETEKGHKTFHMPKINKNQEILPVFLTNRKIFEQSCQAIRTHRQEVVREKKTMRKGLTKFA